MKRTSMTLIAAMSTTLVLAACSDDNSGGGEGNNAKADSDPKAAVMQAFDNANGAKDQSATISMDIDEATLKNLMSSTGADTQQDAMMMDKVTQLLPKTKITVNQHSRDQALAEEKDLKDLDTAFTVHLGEGKIEVRQVEGGMYMRADVDKIGQETGLFTADQLKMQLTGGGSASANDPAVQFMTKALSGEWVGITPEKMNELAEKQGFSLEEMSKQATGTEFSAEQQAKLQKDLKGLMDKHGEFTKDGDTVRVALPIEKSWDDFAKVVNEYAQDADDKMPMLDEDTKKAIKDDAKGYVDVVLDGDQLKGLKLDFSQFTDWIDESSMEAKDKAEFTKVKEQLGDKPLGFSIDYSGGETPAKPDQFTEVPQELLDSAASQGGAMAPGGSAGTQPGAAPSGAGTDPSQMEGMSEEEMAEFEKLMEEMEANSSTAG